MFSIIIAAKDSEYWIQQTLNSVLSQTFDDWECIISINCSSDKTLDICRSLKDPRFIIIDSEIPNKSLAVNRAIIKSTRDFICILDADDVWDQNKLDIQRADLDHVDILGSQMTYVDESGMQKQGTPLLPIKHIDCIEWLNSQKNPIANSSVVYKKSIHDKIGYYDPEKFGIEDYDMWKRAKRAGLTFKNLNEKLLLHRIHSTSNFNSTNRQKILKKFVDEIDIFQKRLILKC